MIHQLMVVLRRTWITGPDTGSRGRTKDDGPAAGNPATGQSLGTSPAAAAERAGVIATLKSESDRVADKIHALYMASEGVVTVTSTVAVAVVALTSSTARFVALLLLPFLILGLMLYATDRNIEMSALGGYKRYLEERINELEGDWCLFWESVIAPETRHPLRPRLPLRGLRIVALLSSAAAGLWAATNSSRWFDGYVIAAPYVLAGSAMYVLGLLALFYGYTQQCKAGVDAYDAAAAAGRSAVPPAGLKTR